MRTNVVSVLALAACALSGCSGSGGRGVPVGAPAASSATTRTQTTPAGSTSTTGASPTGGSTPTTSASATGGSTATTGATPTGGSTSGTTPSPVATSPSPGGAAVPADGTLAHPFVLGDPITLPFAFTDARDTRQATSRAFASYPGHPQDESGPEVIYRFTVTEPARLAATLAFDEPAGTDVDLHLMSGATPTTLVARGDKAIYSLLQPGTYWLIADTFVAGGVEKRGAYELRLSIRSRNPAPSPRFNDYVLAAVDQLYAQHRLQGYGASVLTHDVTYGSFGTIPATGGGRTMCVAAVMEVMLTAMQIWSEDRNDPGVFAFLPIASWKTLAPTSIKAHIWVNASLQSNGSADALRHFKMGENVPFEKLRPGSFLNLNRTTRTGHAVVFLAFVDDKGREHDTWNQGVIGFKYFSAQGGAAVGDGGLDFRYAIFTGHGTPAMPYKRDLNVIQSADQRIMNTGEMWSPGKWGKP